MGNGYPVVQPDDLANLKALIQSAFTKIRELERPTGTQLSDAVATLQALVNGLITQTDVIVSGNVTAGGTVTGVTGVTSVGVYNLDVSTLPGSRRTDWVNQNGQIGYAPSSITKKNLIGPVTITASQFLACGPVVFEYLGQIDIRDNPQNPNYDPDYVVPHELGHIAELLVKNGCGEFVFNNEDGTPAGINYAEFAAVGFIIVGRDHEARITKLEAKA